MTAIRGGSRRAIWIAGNAGKPKIPPAAIVVRHCRGLAEFGTCFEIQRAVWGSADADLVPMPLFVVAAETGGQVLGAFAEDRMVGFTLALAGLHGRGAFLHSHMTAVMDGWRDRGIGRSLKLFQRNDALARGIDLIEWTFDPLQIKNAYFNLVRLGAIARRFIAEYVRSVQQPSAGRAADRPAGRGVASGLGARSPGRGGAAGREARARRRRQARGKIARIRVPAELVAARSTSAG